jgi:hypothetical protein
VYGVLRTGKADYLAVMMAALFVLSLILVAFTGSPKFLLVKESFASACLRTDSACWGPAAVTQRVEA